jgi:hypothetical protein
LSIFKFKDVSFLNNTIQVLGFSDSSELANGAAIYIQSISKVGTITSNLLFSKTRIDSLKRKSLAKLESCVSYLLSHLIQRVILVLETEIQTVTLWSDSTITLAWIPSYQDITSSCKWLHIRSNQNPADLLTRGLKSTEPENDTLCWHGPDFLSYPETEWPSQKSISLVVSLVATEQATWSNSE